MRLGDAKDAARIAQATTDGHDMWSIQSKQRGI